MDETTNESESDYSLDKYLPLKSNIIDQITQGVVILNSKHKICYVNSAFQKMSGYTINDIIGKSPLIFKTSKHHDRFYRKMWKSLKIHGHWEGEVWENDAQGHPFPVMLNISTYKENETVYYIGICTDITTQLEKQNTLHRLAYYDAVTSLPNRQLFYERLTTTIAESRRFNHAFALFYLDIDNFKNINDTLGHAIGDKVLQNVGIRIAKVLREVDFFARIGGDEFTIILPQSALPEHSKKVAHKILTTLSQPFYFNNSQLKVTTSIGICHYPNNGINSEQLLQHADMAMYQAKDKGKNNFQLFTPKTNKPQKENRNKGKLISAFL
jgi:two-component system CheB/CheR fusion protein